MSKWRKLNYEKDIKLIPPGNYFVWHDCTIGLKCGCGNEDVICVDDQNDNVQCEKCGKLYRLCTYVEAKDL